MHQSTTLPILILTSNINIKNWCTCGVHAELHLLIHAQSLMPLQLLPHIRQLGMRG